MVQIVKRRHKVLPTDISAEVIAEVVIQMSSGVLDTFEVTGKLHGPVVASPSLILYHRYRRES